jgi:transcriptional regulator with XRE-family HTH domain
MKAKSSTEAPERSLSQRIGIAIRELRKKAGLSQGKLAKAIGVSPSMISMIESGNRNSKINLDALEKIAHAVKLERLSDLIIFAEDVPELDVAMREARSFIKRYSL